jgi:GT2 family glycosyltransferase
LFSFITITREQEKIEALEKNLSLVLGRTPWELLVADGTKEDIFTGYNQQAALANGDYLVFTHDDVKFLCNGEVFEKPIELMEKPFTGFVGAAGTIMMPKEGCWWKAPQSDCRGSVYHPSKSSSVFGMHLNCWPHMNAQFGQVLVCDGVLLMCHKRVFDKLNGFDAETFKGFHFYDVDITLRAHMMGLMNYVAPVPLIHRSYGMINENWEQNKKLFIEKHNKALPTKI